MLKHNRSVDIGTLPAKVTGNWEDGIVSAGLTFSGAFNEVFEMVRVRNLRVEEEYA